MPFQPWMKWIQQWVKQSGSQIRYQIRCCLTLLVVSAVMVAAVIGLSPIVSAEAASDAGEITVYRDPSCHCCGRWMDHLTVHGFRPENVESADMNTLKQQYGVPADLMSCHTALINGYWIEGHVPAADIQRLLAEQPEVAGIAVPGMPVGTPGMESGDQRDSFTVFSFDKQGNTNVFNQYQF